MRLVIEGFGAVLLAAALVLDLVINAVKLAVWLIGRIPG